MKKIVQEVIEIACKEEGVRERGDNMGARVNEYQRADNLPGVGYAWCGSFVSWCLKQTGQDIRYCYSASCDIILAWARSEGILHDTPQPGDIFLVMKTGSRHDAIHTGLVERVNGAVFHTVEGNTNLSGSRTGIGVFTLKRTNGNRYRFVRWADLHREKNEAPPAPYDVELSGHKLESQMIGAQTFVPLRKWGEALGKEVEWNNDKQVPLFDGAEVPVQISLIEGRAWTWIRPLAEFSEVKLDVDMDKHTIQAKV